MLIRWVNRLYYGRKQTYKSRLSLSNALVRMGKASSSGELVAYVGGRFSMSGRKSLFSSHFQVCVDGNVVPTADGIVVAATYHFNNFTQNMFALYATFILIIGSLALVGTVGSLISNGEKDYLEIILSLMFEVASVIFMLGIGYAMASYYLRAGSREVTEMDKIIRRVFEARTD